MKEEKNEAGFSLIETIIALVILLVGVLGAMQAVTFGVISMHESEKRVYAKQVIRSTVETVFSYRDMVAFDPQRGLTYNWDSIQTQNVSSAGMFLAGWQPIRENPGNDGIFGTGDDACAAGSACTVGGYTNTSPVVQGYERQIEVVDLPENGIVRKRRVTVRVRYWVGNLPREEVQSTIVANLPIG